MLKMNSLQFKNRIENYLYDCSVDQFIDETGDKPNHKKVFGYLESRFSNEFNHEYNRLRYFTQNAMISEWLKGLPIHTHYNYCDILNQWRLIHSVDVLTDSQQEHVTDKWFDILAVQLSRIFKKYGDA